MNARQVEQLLKELDETFEGGSTPLLLIAAPVAAWTARARSALLVHGKCKDDRCPVRMFALRILGDRPTQKQADA